MPGIGSFPSAILVLDTEGAPHRPGTIRTQVCIQHNGVESNQARICCPFICQKDTPSYVRVAVWKSHLAWITETKDCLDAGEAQALRRFSELADPATTVADSRSRAKQISEHYDGFFLVLDKLGQIARTGAPLKN